ncbi:MAG: hypothetical protein KAJ18_10050 [Candidatus Omnitrophica bacterium]|nr:hypothetical protein [Candidatus Omnitrophota bacterium]
MSLFQKGVCFLVVIGVLFFMPLLSHAQRKVGQAAAAFEQSVVDLYLEGEQFYKNKNYRKAKLNFLQVEIMHPDYQRTRDYLTDLTKMIEVEQHDIVVKEDQQAKDKIVLEKKNKMEAERNAREQEIEAKAKARQDEREAKARARQEEREARQAQEEAKARVRQEEREALQAQKEVKARVRQEEREALQAQKEVKAQIDIMCRQANAAYAEKGYTAAQQEIEKANNFLESVAMHYLVRSDLQDKIERLSAKVDRAKMKEEQEHQKWLERLERKQEIARQKEQKRQERIALKKQRESEKEEARQEKKRRKQEKFAEREFLGGGLPEFEEILADANSVDLIKRKESILEERKALRAEVKKDVEHLYSRGIHLFDDKNYSQARKVLEEVDSVWPNYRRTRDYLNALNRQADPVVASFSRRGYQHNQRQQSIKDALDAFIQN